MDRFSTKTGRKISHKDSHLNGLRKGYEDCAVFLDGIATLWQMGIKPGHEVASEALADAAKHIRMLKESI
jgi:hypothetical protein